jgi:hypothetical protein
MRGGLDSMVMECGSRLWHGEPWENLSFKISFLKLLLQGCGFVFDSFVAYFGMCMYGRHTGKVILRLVEAVGESPSSQFLT